MDISAILLLAIIILIILCIVIISLEMFIPLQMKLNMYGVLRPYIFYIESMGGLDGQENLIISALNDLNIDNVVIEYQPSTRFGDIIDFKVSGLYNWKPIISFAKRESRLLPMNYERKIFVRKIIN